MADSPEPETAGQPLLTNVHILLIDDDKQWARVTARLLEAADEAFDVTLAHSLTEGRDRFASTDPECVICDYQLGDGTGLDLLATVQKTAPDRPFILVTGRGDETVASEAIGQGVTDYIPKAHDDNTATLLANRVRNAIVSSRAQRQLDRERRGKAASLDILTSSTDMTKLSRQFCRLLVEDHGYAGAWIGVVDDSDDGSIVPQATAGCEAYLDAVTTSGVVRTDPLDPVVMAAERDEPVAVSPAKTEITTEGEDSWQEIARDHGFVTAAGVPISYESIRIGVLGVYRSSQQPPLNERQLRLLESYSGIVGYAHQTADLKRSLLSDQSIRLDIDIRDTTAPLAEFTDQLAGNATATVVSLIKPDDSETLYLTRVPGADEDAVRTATAACDSLELGAVSTKSDGVQCDLYSTVRTPEDILVSRGAQIEQTVGTNGTTTVSVTFADREMVSGLTDAVRTEYDDITVSTLWNHHDSQPSTDSDDPLAPLTEKQRDVLSHAYFDGYFEQPRGVSATELSEKFDLSRPTVTQHLRAAERKVFSRLFDH